MGMMQSLQAAVVYTDTPNHETNMKLWDAYAKSWSSDGEWVKRMAGHLPGGQPETLQCIGEEWSDQTSLDAVMQEWVYPHLCQGFRVAEIGSGGGRLASRVAGHTRELVCFDISKEMLKAA